MTATPVIDAVQAAVPEWAVGWIAVVSQLGNPAVILLLGVLGYWFGPRYDLFERRDDHRRLVAISVGGLIFVIFLKTLVASPRPPQSLQLLEQDGYSFPSGHVTGAVVGYGAFAWLLEWWHRRTRIAIWVAIVSVVGFTRVALGVHYPIDVVAAIVLGVAFLGSAIPTTRRSPANGFWCATGLGVLTLAAVTYKLSQPGAPTRTGYPYGLEVVAIAAGLAGAMAARTAIQRSRLSETPPTTRTVAVMLVVLAITGVIGTILGPSVLKIAAVSSVVGAGVVGLPAIQNVSR